MKTGKYDNAGGIMRSQHSIFGPVKRIAGPAGGKPRWADSLLRSWNRYELRDIINRDKGKQYYDEQDRPLPHVGTPKRLSQTDVSGEVAA